MKRKRVNRRLSVEKRVEKNIPFELLVISIFFLGVLSAAFIGIKINEKSDVEKMLEGELGTLKWDYAQDYTILEVLDYEINESNLSIEVNVNWTEGDKNVTSIFFNFIRTQGDCNFTTASDLPSMGENKTYFISYNSQGCTCINFENVTDVEAYAEINISLVKIGMIPNVTIYYNENLTNLFNLDDYFNCSINELTYSIPDMDSSRGIYIYHNTENIYGIYANGTGNYNGTHPVTAYCGLDDTIVTSFYINYFNYTRPLANEAPEFNSTYCDNLEWEMNKSYLIELGKCFYDSNGDSLSFRYENASNENLTITQSGNNLTLTPSTNWNGTGYFRVYANDSKTESDGRVDFKIRGVNVSGNTQTLRTSAYDPVIRYSVPGEGEVHIFEGNKTFSISAENYEIIRWYLNGKWVRDGGLTYDFTKLKSGDVVRVDIINGTKMDSKTWNIIIEKEEEEQAVSAMDMGQVIFYLIIGIIIIIIFLVVWLLLSEKNNRKNKIFSGFGFSENRAPPGQFSIHR